MQTKYLDVKDKWGVILCFDLKSSDDYEMRQTMSSFGMNDKHIDNALSVLSHENTGMCVSRNDIRMSLVFIGNATSEEQHWDTTIHELYHVACAICDYYNVSHRSEDFAWTMGYLTRKVVKITGEPCL